MNGTLSPAVFAPGRVAQLAARPSNIPNTGSSEMQQEIPNPGVETNIVGLQQNWDIRRIWNASGWLPGTAYPTYEGNTARIGHVIHPTGLSRPFVNLHRLAWGETFTISLGGLEYTYEVRAKYLGRPNDMRPLRHKDQGWVKLIACLDNSQQQAAYLYHRAVQAVLISHD